MQTFAKILILYGKYTINNPELSHCFRTYCNQTFCFFPMQTILPISGHLEGILLPVFQKFLKFVLFIQIRGVECTGILWIFSVSLLAFSQKNSFTDQVTGKGFDAHYFLFFRTIKNSFKSLCGGLKLFLSYMDTLTAFSRTVLMVSTSSFLVFASKSLRKLMGLSKGGFVKSAGFSMYPFNSMCWMTLWTKAICF